MAGAEGMIEQQFVIFRIALHRKAFLFREGEGEGGAIGSVAL